MKKMLFPLLVLLLQGAAVSAQPDAPGLLRKMLAKFARVQDYKADLTMVFDIPSIRMNEVKGKVFYKRPDRFRIQSPAILFMPKQNPYYTLQALRDSTSFTAVPGGSEVVQGKKCVILNIVPLKESELIFGKLWIDPATELLMQSQITTKSNGTIMLEQQFGSFSAYALPDQMKFTIDVTRFKVPKAIAVDINSKSNAQKGPAKTQGTISLQFRNYLLNKNVPDSVFEEAAKK